MKSPNFALTLVTAAAGGTVDTEFSVTHDLGSIPAEGFIVRRFGNADLYKSTTAWTKTTVYFKSNTANAHFVVGLMA